MLQNIQNLTLRASQAYNISATSAFSVASNLSNSLTQAYNATWSVYCALSSLGDSSFSYLQNRLVQLIVTNNTNFNFFFNIYVSNQLKNNGSSIIGTMMKKSDSIVQRLLSQRNIENSLSFS